MVNLISQNQPSSLDAFIINFQTWVQFIVRTLPLRIINKSKYMNFHLRVLYLGPCLVRGPMVSPLCICLWQVFHKMANLFYEFFKNIFVTILAKKMFLETFFLFPILAYRAQNDPKIRYLMFFETFCPCFLLRIMEALVL